LKWYFIVRADDVNGTAVSMREGRPSVTARRVAAYRLGFDRLAAGFGDPAADERLAADVAAGELLSRGRWQPVEVTDRSKRLGFLVTVPIWRPALPPAPATRSRIGSYMDRTFHRDGTGTLAGHLETAYGAGVERLHRLDVGVYRVQVAGGRRWVARIFAASRPLDVTRGETEILRMLAEAGFPAERCAQPDPVSVHQDQAVVVTDHVAGMVPPATQATFRTLGDLLGRLHALAPRPEFVTRPGGAWHHLADGTPADEITAAVSRAASTPSWPATGRTSSPGLRK
jgi:Phosphotransferase enzyme family